MSGRPDSHVETIHGVGELDERHCEKMDPVERLRLQMEAEKAYYAQYSSTSKAGLRKSTILSVCHLISKFGLWFWIYQRESSSTTYNTRWSCSLIYMQSKKAIFSSPGDQWLVKANIL